MPSAEDRTLTTRQRETGDLLCVRLLDSLILGDDLLLTQQLPKTWATCSTPHASWCRLRIVPLAHKVIPRRWGRRAEHDGLALVLLHID